MQDPQPALDQDIMFGLGTIMRPSERVQYTVFDTASSVRACSGQELEENFQNRDVERVVNDAANVLIISNSNFPPIIRGPSFAGQITGAGAAVSVQLPRGNPAVDNRAQNFTQLAYSPTSFRILQAI